ncbi:MAG: hypothetical protein M1818_000056 [Claussenomyces sp. TS43310]|nr:MAG: hypothetical protein M1818_000056 [Claussenomyces sp. TS43310]
MARNPYARLGDEAGDPYTNGYETSHTTPSTDDYDPYGERYNTPPLPPASPARDRRGGRTGGYGGFESNNNQYAPPVQQTTQPTPPEGHDRYGSRSLDDPPPTRSPRRPAAVESGAARRYREERSQGGSGDSSRSRGADSTRRHAERLNTKGDGHSNGLPVSRNRGNGSAVGSGDGTRQIEEYIQSEWAFMAQDKCVPVQVALQLMDNSSVGRAHQSEQFQQTHMQLQRALKAIVNEHHQGFNSSIGTFHKIQSSIQTSQFRLRGLKETLAQAQTGLSSTRPELKGLAATSQRYDEMLQALAQIEQLKLVTEKLEALISEKRFLTAVDVLQDGLRLLRRPEMDNIGALSDLRVYLATQETSLAEILIEELHSHLYLKSPYCQDRWKAHVKEQSSGPSSDGVDAATPSVRPLWRFLDGFDFSTPMVEDPARNPEADSFYYIQLLVESLNKMGRLDVAVTALEQRLPVELFRVVDKTNNEVDQRHPTSLGSTIRDSKGKVDLGVGDGDIRASIVYDLLSMLYAKFEAIAEGHRVFHDVVTGIAKREKLSNPELLTGSFKELWLLYQNEIRSLLHDYLATDSNMYRMSHSMDANSDIFKRGQRKKDKKIFSASDTDSKSVEMMDVEDLEAILKAFVPSLVSDSRRPTGVTVDDKNQHTDGAATGHKLLIEPSVFNMGLLLPPSLTFIQKLKDIVPPRPDIKTSTLTSFLDDFLVNVFLPQLDETLMKLNSQVFAEPNAFQEDPQWASVSARPIFYGTAAFFSLITAFCRMLDTIPHDQAFSQLIINQMVSYYDNCCDWYKSLVSRTQDANSAHSSLALKVSAAFATGPGDIHDTIKNLWTAEGEERELLLEKETGLLIIHANENPINLADIIQDRKTIANLCLLYTSMRWLASKVNELRHITEHDVDSSRRNTVRVPHGRRWTLLNRPAKILEKSSVHLPMTQESVIEFDAIVSAYQELAALVILTLHMEIRAQIIHHLSLALSPQTAPYVLEQVVNEPDPLILSLNADLVAYNETTSRYLKGKEIDFLRTGLGLIIDTLLVTDAGTVQSMNVNGCGRMQLNILVLQQNLKNIEPDVGLSRAAAYYDLFSAGPDAILERAREGKDKVEHGHRRETYNYDELKTLLELCFSQQISDPERGVSTVARRSMGDKLLQLSEVMWES